MPRAIVAGGDAGGLPRSQPSEEHLDANALKAAGEDGAAKGLRALMVLRHGHLVYEAYGHGVDARSEPDLGDFSQVLVALAAGIAVYGDRLALPIRTGFDPGQLRDAIQSASHQTYPEYLSQHLWRRLNAAPAWIDTAQDAPVPADCCFHARLLDWMRVAEVLVQDGLFEGQQVVPKGWIARMRQPVAADGLRGFGVSLARSAHGAENFAADEVFFLRGPGHWRLWLVPDLKLAVLFGADAEGADTQAWDETRVLNLVLRSVSDPVNPSDPASRLKGLVPGH
jgi:CubicO group peptidase (beta-lactamase class C family)